MIKLGFFLTLLGLAICLDIHPGGAVPGGIFALSKEEISKEKDLFPGIDMAIKKLNAKNERKENKFRYVSEELVKVSRQMVSGKLFYVTMNMATSTCENTNENDNKDLKDCPVDPSGKKLTCKFRILSRPWHPRKNLRLLVTGILCDERQ